MNQLAMSSDETFTHFLSLAVLWFMKLLLTSVWPDRAHTYISMNINIFNNFVFCFIFHPNGW